MIELYLLLAFVIIGAIIAAETRSLLSAVVSLGVVGFGICLIFFILRAPDVAITQLVVEVIALVILIRATGIKRDLTSTMGGMREFFSWGVVAVFIIFFAFTLYLVLPYLPKFGEPLMRVSQNYLTYGLSATGARNIVTAVLLDFRGYDTLGEATILFTAIIGTIAILRRKGRKKVEERDDGDS